MLGLSAGGLVTAVAPVVIKCGGRWVGWPGPCPINEGEQIPEACPGDITPTAGILSKQVVIHVTHLSFLKDSWNCFFLFLFFFTFYAIKKHPQRTQLFILPYGGLLNGCLTVDNKTYSNSAD